MPISWNPKERMTQKRYLQVMRWIAKDPDTSFDDNFLEVRAALHMERICTKRLEDALGQIEEGISNQAMGPEQVLETIRVVTGVKCANCLAKASYGCTEIDIRNSWICCECEYCGKPIKHTMARITEVDTGAAYCNDACAGKGARHGGGPEPAEGQA